MHLGKDIEEALSIIWEQMERNVKSYDEIKTRIIKEIGRDVADDLVKHGFISISKGNVVFSSSGEKEAKSIVRRQRLAERLLTDVLELKTHIVDSAACEFEHIISSEVEESICILLGHPRECPHGLKIPEGQCCLKGEEELKCIVFSLDKLNPGEEGRIVYVLTQAHPQLHRLFSLGLVPGSMIKVHQKFPSIVIQSGELQIALDQEVARGVYIKKCSP